MHRNTWRLRKLGGNVLASFTVEAGDWRLETGWRGFVTERLARTERGLAKALCRESKACGALSEQSHLDFVCQIDSSVCQYEQLFVVQHASGLL